MKDYCDSRDYNCISINSLILKMYIVLFTLSVSVAAIGGGAAVSFGLHGEIRKIVVRENEDIHEQHVIKQKDIAEETARCYNEWLLMVPGIIMFCFLIYAGKLPPKRTLVSIHVRMDN